MPTRSSFAFAPAGQTFPRFAFLKLTADTVAVTHHHMDGKILRKRTDRVSTETAARLCSVLVDDMGFEQTTNRSHS